VKAVRDEESRLRDRWDKLAELLVAEATQEELEVSLRPLARRLLCSPRLRIALEDRLNRRPAPTPLAGARLDLRQERLAEHWEDVLLLDAVRYLLLTDDQLQSLLSLEEKAAERLAALRREEERTRTALEQAVARERRELLEGRAVPPAEHEQVLNAMRTAREKREAAEEKIAAELAPELGRLLTREQVLRAFLLARGEWPREEARSPMLLDSEARFVIDADARRRWRDEAVASLVARRFPKEWVAAANDQHGATIMFTALLDSSVALRDLKVSGQANPLPAFPPAVVEAAQREHDRLTERWNGLATLLEEGGATPDELELALRPLVRRMFPSPRLRPVVTERLQRGAPLAPEELLPPPPEGGVSAEPAPS
jgi:hypothetical protein